MGRHRKLRRCCNERGCLFADGWCLSHARGEQRCMDILDDFDQRELPALPQQIVGTINAGAFS